MRATFTKTKSVAFCTICLMSFWLWTAKAQDNEDWLVRTKTVDGFYVRVFSSHNTDTTNNTSVDNNLAFCVWQATTSNNVAMYMPTALEYVYQLELLDTNGFALPKKKLAEKIGVKFWDFKPLFDNETGFDLTRVHITPSLGGPYLFFPHRPGHYNGEPNYSPNDLFEIKQPGNYTLRIRFQFIVSADSDRYKSAHVVRFPPLDYPLVRRAGQTNLPSK